MPGLEVTADRYRFRVLNASHARVYRLALSNGDPLTVIGSDGGLLRAAVVTDDVFLGVGERVDLLVDFSNVAPGERLMLKSLPFSLPVLPGETSPQGLELDLLELVVTGPGQGSDPPLPAMLSNLTALDPGDAVGTRQFELSSTTPGPLHQINGTTFDMNRIDFQVPFDQVERWSFFNDSSFPHPVHLHGTQFRIVARLGGRNVVLPYEEGWKDTTVVMPFETVEILVRFDGYRGVFPMHCHNLQHEDMGMMLNFEVF
jgi:FtsP/CotA-like multicopper oxidase with cupredoxin domain